MKKLSDTLVTESKGEVMRLLTNMDSEELWNCFMEFINADAASDFLNDCLFSDKEAIRNLAKSWMVSKMIDENVTMDDLEESGWC